MGLKHGRDCLGCCWALMLLAFIGGTMNLAWMGFAMVLMTLEKLSWPGPLRHPTVGPDPGLGVRPSSLGIAHGKHFDRRGNGRRDRKMGPQGRS